MKSSNFIKGVLGFVVLLLCGGKAMACGGDDWGPDRCNHFSLVQPLDPEQTGVNDV